jgi:cytochrome c oxidase assembly protein subunit 16
MLTSAFLSNRVRGHNATRCFASSSVCALEMDSVSSIVGRVKKFTRRKSVRYGLPFISLLVVGSFGLSEFSSIVIAKREQKNRRLTTEEARAFQNPPKEFKIEEEYERTMKKLDIDHWENKRGPRPWEE